MKRILVTRPKDQNDLFFSKLRTAGFEPIAFPVIEIQRVENNPALDRALQALNCYAWVVFTSVNGVHAFWDRANCTGIPYSKMLNGSHPPVRLAAIGPKTAAAIKSYGVNPAFVPHEYIADEILPGLGDLHNQWILLPRAEIARKDLPTAIQRSGGIAHEITVYRTIPAHPDEYGLAQIRLGVDVITLTSPSTVENFINITHQAGLDVTNLPGKPTLACIGPITKKAAEKAGLPNLVMAEEYTTEGLIKAIQNLG